ncbi:MAG: hypothetical protein RLO19_14510 [Coleofasciculus sp. G2-EDA-02]
MLYHRKISSGIQFLTNTGVIGVNLTLKAGGAGGVEGAGEAEGAEGAGEAGEAGGAEGASFAPQFVSNCSK